MLYDEKNIIYLFNFPFDRCSDSPLRDFLSSSCGKFIAMVLASVSCALP